MRIQAFVAMAALALCPAADAQQMSLTSTFVSTSFGAGNMFDIVALNTVIIDSFDVNVSIGNHTIEVYTHGGSYVGTEGNPAAWTLLGSASVVSAGAGAATPVPVNLNICIPAGATQAFYVTVSSGIGLLQYTNGTAVGAVYAQDANIQLLEGAGVAYPFGGSAAPRVWNGTIYYTPGSPCIGPPYQVNQANASLDIGGLQSSGLTPAVTVTCVNLPVTMNVGSAAPTVFDLAIVPASLVPGPGPPALITGGLQTVNVDTTHPVLTFLNSGGALPSFQGFAPFSISFAVPTPLLASAQLVVLDPGSVDGAWLSQGVELSVSQGSNTLPGPTGDDAIAQIPIGGPPLCSPAVPFCGTAYSELFVSSNGRVSFGAGDDDYSPTVAEAINDTPFAGFWTDLSPNLAGSITVGGGPTSVAVQWAGVPYFGSTAAATSFSIVFDGNGVITFDVNGLTLNPITGGTGDAGDAQFFGLSCGNGAATNPGAQPFGPGASGNNTGNPTDMLYDFLDGPGVQGAGGLLPSISALQGGVGLLTFTPGTAPGEYLWTGS